MFSGQLPGSVSGVFVAMYTSHAQRVTERGIVTGKGGQCTSYAHVLWIYLWALGCAPFNTIAQSHARAGGSLLSCKLLKILDHSSVWNKWSQAGLSF